MSDAFDRWLARVPFVIGDGGLATLLEERGHDLGDPLWSARLLLDDPEAIERAHLDYFRAGAELATTASYQASLPGLRARGLDAAAARGVLHESVVLATRARDTFVRERDDDTLPAPLVVASLGSYGAVLADGSEYTGAFAAIDDQALVRFHRERIEVLAEGSDLFAFETIASRREAVAIVRALHRITGPRAWVAFTCRDDRHSGAGDTIEDCVAALRECEAVAAIGINCTEPTHVEALLRRIAAVDARPRLAYPNAGERYDGATRRFCGPAIGPERFAEAALRWHTAGARLVGGCCRTGLAHVAALAAARAQRGDD